MKLSEYLSKLSSISVLLIGVALVGAIGLLDYVTGPDISFSIFYLLPVSFVAWYVGRTYGLLMCVVSAAVWLGNEMVIGTHYSNAAIPYWNAAVRMGFFVIVTFTLSALRNSQDRQEELAHFIVHDLQSPLANLAAGINTLERIGGKSMSSSAKDLIELSLANCAQMSILVESLLDLARLESGKMPIQRSRASVEDIVSSSLDQVRAVADRNKVQLVADIAKGLPPVEVDYTLTKRVVVNLLTNALRFSQPKSLIVVRANLQSTAMVEVSVTDQGSGIPEEWTSKVFDKFTQMDARKSGSSVGAGLGLTFCRKLIEAQGGRIWLRSIVSEGTTVIFTLPLVGEQG